MLLLDYMFWTICSLVLYVQNELTCCHLSKFIMCWTICSLVLLVMLLLYYLGILSTCDAAAVPREALEFAEMSINFRSGKFGYSICPIFSKVHAEIFREF